ncbi:MAG: hypothetical protein ACTTKH_03825 [Treponema sp.]
MEWLDRHYVFSIKQLFDDLEIRNTKLNREFCENIFYHNKIAYNIEGKDLWMSRANLFNNKCFSVTLTELEHKKKILIPGSRFIPYTNHFFKYRQMHIEYHGKRIKQKPIGIPFKELKEYYYLCSEKELLSILESFSMNNVVLPDEFVNDNDIFYVPAYNISPFYNDMSFTDEDQIVLKVLDWGHVKLDLVTKTPNTIDKKYKTKWETEFKLLLRQAVVEHISENYLIEDIIAFMVFLKPELFFNDECFVSVENSIKDMDIIESIDFGVKNRLWVKEAPIILSNEWFHYVYGIPNVLQVLNKEDDFLCTIGSPVTMNIIRVAVYKFLDENYMKLDDDGAEMECVDIILHEFFRAKKWVSHHKKLTTMIKKEYQRYVEQYSPFKNREGILLAFALFQLFSRMFFIVSYIDDKRLLPDKIEISIVIMLNQFAEDLTPLIKMMAEFLYDEHDVNINQKKREIDMLCEKFSSFLDNIEEYIFSSF